MRSNARADDINKQHGVIFALIYTEQEKEEKESKGLDEGVLRETWAGYVWLNASPSSFTLSLFHWLLLLLVRDGRTDFKLSICICICNQLHGVFLAPH